MPLTATLRILIAQRRLRSPGCRAALAAAICQGLTAGDEPTLRQAVLATYVGREPGQAPPQSGWRHLTLRLHAAQAGPAQATALCAALDAMLPALHPDVLAVDPAQVLNPPRLPAGMGPPADELCLNFLTPMALHGASAAARYDPAALLALLRARYRDALGTAPDWPDDAASLQVLGHMAAQQQNAGPAAQPRSEGFMGPLYLRGASASLVQGLAELSEVHLPGTTRSLRVEWRGRYALTWQHKPCLDRHLLNPARLAAVACMALQRDDIEPVRHSGGTLAQPAELAQQIIAAMQAPGGWQPQPNTVFTLHREGQAPRSIERLGTADLVLQQHLLQILQPVFEPLLDDTSYGFRPGRGRDAAVNALRAALRQGNVHVLRTDIARCFDSIDHTRLLALLDGVLLRSDKLLRQVLGAFIHQPCVFEGRTQARSCGLAQGAPLSPLLANLFLTGLDRSIDPRRWHLVRYADDIVVLTRTHAEADEALRTLGAAAAALGLALSPAKTHLAHLRDGFSFLGETFSPATLEPAARSIAAQRKPLLVTEDFLQLGVNGEALEARRGSAVVGTWPLRRLGGIMLMARCNLSSAMLERCSKHDIPIAVSLRSGKQISVLMANQRQAHDALHRHGCWHDALSPAARLALAQAIVDAKLANSATLVRQREPASPLLERLAEARRAAQRATTTDALRGHEGVAARHLFAWLQAQVLPPLRADFCSRRRARGGPDRLNSALNLGYYLLYTRLNAMLRLRGLNPYLGWLHDADDDYETLVYDLMEPFRAFVDRLLLRQINRQALQARHFELRDGQWRLTRQALRDFAEAFERMLGEAVGRHRLRDLMWLQVRAVDDLVGGRASAWVFQWQSRKEDDAAPPGELPLLTLRDDPWTEEEETSPPASPLRGALP